MSPCSFSQLCAALGFSVAFLTKEIGPKKRKSRAVEVSRLIEDFCYTARPEIFEAVATSENTGVIDRQIEGLKKNIIETGEAHLPHDVAVLHQLYERLSQRHKTYATEDHIANAALYFLDEEISKEKTPGNVADDPGLDDFLCHEMEATIVRIMRKKGECSPADLKTEGFAAGDVERLWKMAYALARVSLGWMDS